MRWDTFIGLDTDAQMLNAALQYQTVTGRTSPRPMPDQGRT
jgi:hypothetical protein